METFFAIVLCLFLGFSSSLVFALIIYWVDRYEKEPILLLGGVFTWGAIVAAGSAFIINTVLGLGVYLFTESEAVTDLSTGSIIAPFVEEILKGLAVLMVFLFFRKEFDSVLDGIVYAAIAALGFAATENSYYIFSYGYQENGWNGIFGVAFIRIILVGWQHPFYTAFFGIGLAYARLSRNILVKLAAPIIGLALAMFTHAMHNTLAGLLPTWASLTFGTLLDWTGWLVMAIFIIWALYRERRWIVDQLREEVSLGIITPAQYHTTCSAWAQSLARLNALFSGRWQATNRFYQVGAELAYKKQQRAMLGEEGGNTTIIDSLRAELTKLAPKALT